MKNDIAYELGKSRAVLLVLLDISAAFDNIDHDIPVHRFKDEYGVGGSALSWFDSYLRDRNTRVCISSSYSNVHLLKYGVPQGSVAGPPIFTAYSKPVTEIFKRFGIAYHVYADDTQPTVSAKLKRGCLKTNSVLMIQRLSISSLHHRDKLVLLSALT